MAVTLSSTLACTITSSGIEAPTYDEIYSRLVSIYQLIFGTDIVLDNSTQDGQLVGIFAEAIDQVNSSCVATFNSFSPTFGQGTGLSSTVKINGISRKSSSYSTVDLLLTGTAGTNLVGCSAKDTNGYIWTIPDGSTIDPSGTQTVTAVCTTLGSVTAQVGTVNIINTPILGWSGVTNLTIASSGSPVESDATLRQRQKASTMLPTQTVMNGTIGSILELPGVITALGYENDTDKTDANGLAPHTIAVVVDGGDAISIAQVIANTKTMGVPTAGNTTENLVDSFGNTRTINFYRPDTTSIYVSVALNALTGYMDIYGAAIASQISAYISSLSPGQTLYLTRLYSKAVLPDDQGGLTYDITSIQIGTSQTSLGTGNITLGFASLPLCPVSNVTVTATGG